MVSKQEYKQKELIRIYELRRADIARSESNLCLLTIGAAMLLWGVVYSHFGAIISFSLIPLFAVVFAMALSFSDKWRRKELEKLTETINKICDENGIERFI